MESIKILPPPVEAPYRLGNIKNKFIILECFSFDDYRDMLIPFICRISKSYRDMMIRNFIGVQTILREADSKRVVTNHN